MKRMHIDMAIEREVLVMMCRFKGRFDTTPIRLEIEVNSKQKIPLPKRLFPDRVFFVLWTSEI